LLIKTHLHSSNLLELIASLQPRPPIPTTKIGFLKLK
jgi:hypothetical protein